MTLVGILSLGIGYYIAVTIDDPLTAVYLFFIAVILVIIGTYCLFTAGSITILKFLKKNKHFYYQTKHFTSVSLPACNILHVTTSGFVCIFFEGASGLEAWYLSGILMWEVRTHG